MFYQTSLFLITLCLTQISVSQSAAIDDAQAALNQLQDRLGQGVTDALSNYVGLSQKTDSVFLATKSNGTAVIQQYGRAAVQEMESIISYANGAGVDISSCREVLEGYIRSVEPENTNGLIQCVNDHTGDAVDHVHSSSINVVRLALQNIKDNEQALVHCGKIDSTCLSALITKIQQDASSVVSNIINTIFPQDSAKHQEYLDAVQDQCGTRYTVTAQGQSSAYLVGFQICVDDIITKL